MLASLEEGFAWGQSQGAGEQNFWSFLSDPTFLQVGVALLFLLVLLRVAWVLKKSLRRTRARKRLTDYLEAVESVLSGDAKSAVLKLERVLSEDPENLGARLALAKADLELHRPAEAHRRNLEAIEVFGAEGAGVEYAMIRSLIAAGEEGEALEHLKAAASRFPGDQDLLELSWELHENCGLFEAAIRAGKKVYSNRPNNENRMRLARTFAKAGAFFLERGKKKEALESFKESLSLNSDEIQAKRGYLSLNPTEGEKLLGQPLFVLKENELPPDGRAPQPSLDPLGEIFTDAECPVCHAPRNPEWESCKSCGDNAPSVYAHDQYMRVVPNPRETLDGIERNESWLQLQLEKIQHGDEGALSELEAAGERSLPLLLRFLCTTAHPQQSLFDLCLRFAQKNPQAFLQAIKNFKNNRSGIRDLLGLETPGRNLIADLVGSLGGSGLEAFRKERDSAEALSHPQRRSMILDYFIGLKDAEEFDALFARFSPFEIIRHLNQSSPSRVADLMLALASSEGPSCSLFVEEALGCEDALILALGKSKGEVQKRILQWVLNKGPRPSLIHRLVEKLDQDNVEIIETALNGFALEGRKVLVERFADPRLPPRCSAVLQRVLLQAGPGVIADLCRCFGSAPAPSDDRICAVLVQFGVEAVPEILRAYKQHRGFLAMLGIQQNLARHARSLLLRVLAQIAPKSQAFLEIESFEKDPELLSLVRYLRTQEGGSSA